MTTVYLYFQNRVDKRANQSRVKSLKLGGVRLYSSKANNHKKVYNFTTSIESQGSISPYNYSTTNKNDKYNNIYYKNLTLAYNRSNDICALPEKVYNFHNHIYVRVARFLMGFCFILFIWHKWGLLIIPGNILIFLMIISFIHLTYIAVINSIRIVVICYRMYRGDWKIYNSPLNRFSSRATQLLCTLKGGCIALGAGGGVLGSFYLFDDTLQCMYQYSNLW